jgi:hypothetical protein
MKRFLNFLKDEMEQYYLDFNHIRIPITVAQIKVLDKLPEKGGIWNAVRMTVRQRICWNACEGGKELDESEYVDFQSKALTIS